MSADSCNNTIYTSDTDHFTSGASSNNVSPVSASVVVGNSVTAAVAAASTQTRNVASGDSKSYGGLDQSSFTVKHYAQLLLEKDKRVR